jgi:arsenate reductase-like glutaredoxin family protein
LLILVSCLKKDKTTVDATFMITDIYRNNSLIRRVMAVSDGEIVAIGTNEEISIKFESEHH